MLPTAQLPFNPESLSWKGAIVDMFPKWSMPDKTRKLPMFDELKAYLMSLDSVFKPDHVYIGLKHYVDADAFTKGWFLMDKERFPKTVYAIQHRDDFPNELVDELEGELKAVYVDFDYGSRKAPNHFRGPAFALSPGPSKATYSPLSVSRPGRRTFAKRTFAVQAVRRLEKIEADLEAMWVELIQGGNSNDVRIKASLELEDRICAYREKLSRYSKV